MADNPSEKKISETSGVKAVLDEAAERIEATWREKLLRETGDLRTENALLRAQLDEFNRKLVEARDRNERLEADCNERALIGSFIRTLPTFIRTCADECGNPIP